MVKKFSFSGWNSHKTRARKFIKSCTFLMSIEGAIEIMSCSFYV